MMRNNLVRTIVLIAILWLGATIAAVAGEVAAPDYIKWQVTSSGGNVSGGAYRVAQAIGQTSAGFSTPGVARVNAGFVQAWVLGCCVGNVGNIDCDGGDVVDVGDLTALIDNLFINFTPLCCDGEANCDGVGGVDVGDLTSLIDNLFINFTPLPACL